MFKRWRLLQDMGLPRIQVENPGPLFPQVERAQGACQQPLALPAVPSAAGWHSVPCSPRLSGGAHEVTCRLFQVRAL